MFCWYFRFMISSAADVGGRLPAAAQRHIHNCTDCQAFHGTCVSLGEALSRESASLDDELPAEFGRRVLAAVPAQGADIYKLPIRWLRPALAAACIAVAVLLGTLLLTLTQDEPIVVERGRFDGIYRLIDEDLPASWAGFVEKPLTDEIENLTEGTESAVRFLVACVAVNPTNSGYELPN